MDVGVYYEDTLVAFVEIDGDFHYKFRQSSQEVEDAAAAGRTRGAVQLRRKDRLKEFCYRSKYPDVPLFRIRSDQCEELGMQRAGKALATWIVASLGRRGLVVAAPSPSPASAPAPAGATGRPPRRPKAAASAPTDGASRAAGAAADAAAAKSKKPRAGAAAAKAKPAAATSKQ